MTPGVHVFLKAPRPGHVKTRLAASIGDARATALYRALAERTLATVAETGWEATVWYAPADAESEMRAWLGPSVRLRPQPAGDLGARMATAAATAGPDGAALLLGGDCPGLDVAHLRAAAAALERVPVVLGPTEDGGYWLLAGRAPFPPLFDDMAWSTAAVLPETRRRLDAAGIAWHELPVLRDVDTLDDVVVLGLELP